ncbi:MAG: MBL fold metallo-hydrolase [Deltaproteobacteria bacterium]|nr:MBL fold metallo-hydrolase [Deltaproteobacteria bacterium]
MAQLFTGVSMFFLVFALTAVAQGFETDTIKTSAGDLKITFIGHGTLILSCAGKVIHVDPVSQLADYSKLPKADVILVTHEHHDHFDLKALDLIRTSKTVVAASESCAGQLKDFIIMKNGDVKTIGGFKVEAVPAYNIVHMRSKDVPYHPKNVGNGYVITFGDRRVYIAGDTENIPEMKNLEAIDIAFLPMNLPYTMTPEMVAAAAKSFEPKILYPYHFSDTDTSRIVELLKDTGIEVRIRKMN